MALTNGNFETGDLTGWDDSESSGGTVEVVAAAVRNGTYGLRLKGDIINPAQDYPLVTQMMPRDFSTITLWYKCNDISGTATPNCYLTVNIVTDTDFWAEVYEVHNPAEGGWVEVTVSKATITSENEMATEDWGTGDIQLRIEQTTSSTTAGDVSFDLFIDDVHYETLPNGGFELGDLTDWTSESTGSGTYTATETVTTGAKRFGIYGARLYVSSQSEGSGHATITTVLADSGWDYLSLWLKFNSLVRDFVGYSEVVLRVQMNISATPTWIAVRTIAASDIDGWHPFIVLLDELDAIRVFNSGTWISNEIPFKIDCYNYCEESTAHPCELFVDDVGIYTIPAFSNGDFETNDLTGWDNESYVYHNSTDETDGTATTATSGTEKHAGSYAAKMNCALPDTVTDGAVYASIIRPLVVADFATLTFWYKITDATGGNPKFQVQVWAYFAAYGYFDWVTVYELSGGGSTFVAGSWTGATVEKSGMITDLTAAEAEFVDTTVVRFISNYVEIPS